MNRETMIPQDLAMEGSSESPDSIKLPTTADIEAAYERASYYDRLRHSIMSTTNILIVVAALSILVAMLFLPVLTRMKAGPAFLFIFLFINTTLAQTDLMYPAFCMIPMCLVGVPMAEEKPEEKTEEKPEEKPEGKEEAADEQNADPVYGQ